MPVDCGVEGDGSCCESPQVQGGFYFRAQNVQAPATVSSFRLDRYEVTVGRFRQFIDAYSQHMIPAGAGKNPNDPDDLGWSPDDDASLPADVPALVASVRCSTAYETLVDEAELTRPINCLNWYVARAFCTWDGGRLPTEAEWNYAAAGALEQRPYPWGTPMPGSDNDLAIYGCYYRGTGPGTCYGRENIARVGLASAGEGRWGQLDLAGNVWEWTLDFSGTLPNPLPCNDCANHTVASLRIARGGGYDQLAKSQVTNNRDYELPEARLPYLGVRCARDL